VSNAIDRDGLEPAYLKPDGTYSLARDGQLQKPLTGQSAKDAAAYSESRTTVGGGDKVFEHAEEGLSTAGTALQTAGYAAAPFTEGESLGLVKVGEYFDMAATGVSVLHDLLKGEVKSAAIKTAVAGLSFGLGEGVDKLAESGKISNVQKVIVKAQLSVASKVGDKGVQQLTSKEKSESTKIEPAKRDAIPAPPPLKLKTGTTN